MNFDYSDEQKMLKDAARRFLAVHCTVERVRAVLDNPAKSHDEVLWKSMGTQGWFGAAIPERYGGLGLGRVELCAVAEELGRVIAPVPFASTVYFLAEALMLAGNEEQKARYLPQITAAELIGCFGTSEAPGPFTASRMEARVDRGKLTGKKIPVTDGDVAGLAVVAAKENGQPGLFLVDLARSAGVTRESLTTLDPTRSAAQITFSGAPAERLGAPGEGMSLLEAIMDRAAVLLAFEQLGGADRSLEMARTYALQRHAFGRAIGSYQAIKHKLAEMYVKNELARSNAYYGAWALESSTADLPLAASAARVAASEAFWFAAKENLQTHGGMGFTWEVDCHLYYRRSRQLALVAGAPKLWKERLVSQLERRNAT
jgi:alkylation response protein AidB-like acyl-CoA dehydrogenase